MVEPLREFTLAPSQDLKGSISLPAAPPALPAPKTKFDVWREAQVESRLGVEAFQFAVLTNF
jgi:hypothetical protein